MSRQSRGAQRIFERNQRAENLESISGTGSTLSVTASFRSYLEDIIPRLAIDSIVDVPCGDWNWMSLVDLGQATYWGGDIVEDLVLANQRAHGSEGIQFKVFDAIAEVPPTAKLIICRDFLFHVPLKSAEKILRNFAESGAEFLLTTTFDSVRTNKDLTLVQKAKGWGWRPINVELAPFNLEPIQGEEVDEPTMNRHQRLYRLSK